LEQLLSPHFLLLLARERQTIADVLSHPAIVLLDRPKQIVILEKMHVSDNVILYTLSLMVCHRFMALGSTWCNFLESVSQRDKVCNMVHFYP